jgi:predicted anti-sigma-YlaC factor YlaD
MDCKLIKVNLPDYAEGNTSEELRIEIGKHLISCNECRSYSKTVLDFIKLVDTEKSLTASPFLITRIEEKLKSAGEDNLIPLRFRLIKTYSYYAAIIVIALGIGVFSGKQLGTLLNKNETNVVITSESEQLKQDFYLNEIEKDDVSQVLNNQ